jgi:uncharacterized membrane protein
LEDRVTIAFPLHVLAALVFVGGVFSAVIMSHPLERGPNTEAAASVLWQQALSRVFAWAWSSLLLTVGTGIVMVFLKFGGFSGVPPIHRANMAIGIPAMLLFGYAFFKPWQRYRHAIAHGDPTVARQALSRVRRLMTVILGLGLLASVVSALGRYI